MDQPIIISVIVPIYNIFDYLSRCVDSIRQQTYPYLDIILVDDGSTDRTGALAEKLALEDKRIRVFHKENGGSSSARNLGIQNAKGEYLGFVDSDDYIEPQMYERLLAAAVQENLLMVQCSRDEMDEQGNRLPDVCVPPEEAEIRDSQFIMRELLLHRGDCSFCTRLTHRSLFEGRKFPEGELNEDFYLLVQMLPDVPRIAVLPQQDYHVFYRYGSNSRTHDENYFPPVFTDIVRNADRVADIVKKRYPLLSEESMRFGLFQRLDYMLHIPISQMNSENEFYQQVKEYLRKHKIEICKNHYLTGKNKRELLLLSMAPKLVRKVHRMLMQARKRTTGES